MKSGKEIMDILEAYDLTGSYRAAAELAGCDHQTVARYVQLRERGERPVDRLLHHAHVVVTQGESFRLAEATTGKGVMPLR